MHADCIFCKIVAKQIPATVIAENKDVLVIKDIAPQAPIHYLIVPKMHVVDISQLPADGGSLAGALLMMAKELSQLPRCEQFKLQSNNGPRAGQVVFHIHLHFLAGF